VVDGTADLSGGHRTGRLVLGKAIRSQLEASHRTASTPTTSGLVIAACAGAGADPDVLIVLAGALGIHPEEADQIPRPSPEEVTTHAVRF
jgi:hypothetical protein